MNSVDEIIKSDLDHFKDEIESVSSDISIQKLSMRSYKHIRERMIERDINSLDLRELMHKFDDHVDEYLKMAFLDYEKRPFKINIRSDKAIIVTSRLDDYKWKLTTVLNPRFQNLYDDEVNSDFEKTIKV